MIEIKKDDIRKSIFVWHESYYSGIVFANSLEEAKEKMKENAEDNIHVEPLLMRDEDGYYEYAASKGYGTKEQDLDIFIINDQ